MVTEQAVLDALRGVTDPERQQDIVSLGMVRDLRIQDSEVSLTLAFTTHPPAAKAALHSAATRAVSRVPGVTRVQVRMGSAQPAARPAPPEPPRPELIPEVRHTVAVSSGKGGVGKSTVAVNLALALQLGGARVGIVDADVYGPDVPLMLGARDRPGVVANRILPVEAHGLRLMSLGLLVQEREPLVWRGPMIHSFIQQMLRDVLWGALDYLVFDMPPGTGDAQISLSQVIPLSGVVMVTTPQDVALLDVRKAMGMFQRLQVPILGVVENMSVFACPRCGETTAIFGRAGGQRLAEEYGVPLLAQLPLDPEIREGGDAGVPITVRRPDSLAGRAFRELAAAVARRLEESAGARPLPKLG